MTSTIRLESNGAFDSTAALATLANHAIPGFDIADTDMGRHTRLLNVDGQSQLVRLDLDNQGVSLTSYTNDRAINNALEQRVRFWFDLDTDLTPIMERFHSDPVLGVLSRARPGIRITRVPESFEATIMTVLGQQVSLAAARLFGGRFVNAYGMSHDSGLRCFPSPARVLAESHESLRNTLGVTHARARTVRAVAELFDNGIAFDQRTDPLIGRQRLLAITGIGAWSADYLSIRAMSDPDAFPASDAVLRRALAGITAPALTKQAVVWAPYRSYAASLLWAGTSSP